MKIGIYSFAHTHAAGYVKVLSGRDDVEIMAADPGAAARRDEEGGRAAAEAW